MPCLIALIACCFPRLVMVVMWLTTDYLARAFQTALWPVLGFLFLPYTTLAYAWAKNSHGSVEGIHLVVVIAAVLVDLGVLGGGAGAKRMRARG